MKKVDISRYAGLAIVGVILCVLFRAWDEIIGFFGMLIAAVAPLFVGMAIAYVVSIPTHFLERHFFPNSSSKVVRNIRRPVCLAIAIICIVSIIVLSSVVLIPALVETVEIIQMHGQSFVEEVIAQPFFQPVREPVHSFLVSDLVQDFKAMDIQSIVHNMFGGNISGVTDQVLSLASGLMTGFFGLLFSFILLTDNTNAADSLMMTLSELMGFKRIQQFALLLGVADATFHNFTVRQFIEASILGMVSALVLFLCGFSYALGVGMLVFMLALIPIVGYPVGLVLGAFMVAIFDVWTALLFVVVVVIAQLLESTLLLPRVGDPRTVLPPVWITVGVTIGGGVAGFVGMLVAIPITATIRQLVLMTVRRRQAERGRLQAEQDKQAE